jgi:hypothetical protein
MEPTRYEMYEYCPLPPRPPRRITHPGYYRIPSSIPPPPYPSHYNRGYFCPPSSRAYAVRYDYE